MDNDNGIFSGKVSLEKGGIFTGRQEEALAPEREPRAELGAERVEHGQESSGEDMEQGQNAGVPQNDVAGMPGQDAGAQPYYKNEVPGQDAGTQPYSGNGVPGQDAGAQPYSGNGVLGQDAGAQPYYGNGVPGQDAGAQPCYGNGVPGQDVGAQPYYGNGVPGQDAGAQLYYGNEMPGQNAGRPPYYGGEEQGRNYGMQQMPPYFGYDNQGQNQETGYHFDYGNQGYSYGQNGYRYQEQGGYEREMEIPVTLGEWLLSMVLMLIPCVNIVLMLVWAFGDKEKKSKSNFFKASLIFNGILMVVAVLWFMFFGVMVLMA